ncbi:MAG: saccharopine dehydrogenase NADP-binding domain-containing protein [Deltaproteobacteria bacterium]|nr:saccharopine dehydrogenase NADP-binding domain-containing protein [Deltaproteobacteria bacterium]
MAKVIVLGGCGAVGSVAVKTLAAHAAVSKVVIGDLRQQLAVELAAEIGDEKVSALKVDVLDRENLRAAMRGCDLVLNCTGPFYRFVKPILRAVIEAKLAYVDVCDDVDVTSEILAMDQDAKRAGITALIGMGSSPGVTNILALMAARNMLDETESIDIYHAHGGEPVEGEGVIGHRFHCMTIDVPIYLDGELKTVKFFEPEGIALQEEVDFYRLGEKIRVYPYPHPEQLTLPNYIKVKRVTNKGTVLPAAYYELTKDLCRLGLASREPIEVKGQSVVPYDFAVAYIIKQRERILKESQFGSQRGATKVVVAGRKNDKPQTYVFNLASENQALGEGTGIPAAMGVILMLKGKISKKGVLPPEACVDPLDFLALLPEVMPIEKGGKSFDGVVVESIDHTGQVTRLDV